MFKPLFRIKMATYFTMVYTSPNVLLCKFTYILHNYKITQAYEIKNTLIDGIVCTWVFRFHTQGLEKVKFQKKYL